MMPASRVLENWLTLSVKKVKSCDSPSHEASCWPKGTPKSILL